MKEVDRWSQVSTLFLWLVKDRLSLSDNACLSSVCKNWNMASQSYTPKPQNHPALPWIIHMLPKTTTCELLNFSTMEKIVLDIPEFQNKPQILFSRRGWLLLHVFGQPSIVLFNLLNNARIEIQIPGKIMISNALASFSFTNDLNPTPHHLVFASFGVTHLKFYIVDVGTNVLTEHLLDIGRRTFCGVSIRVVRDHVFLLTTSGTMFCFDMICAKWKEIVPWNGSNFIQCIDTIRMTETEVGEIVQIVGDFNTHSFKFFKLDCNKTSWQELSKVNMMWFMSCSGYDNLDWAVNSPNTGTKVYQLDSKGNYINNVDNHGSIVRQAVHVYGISSDGLVYHEEKYVEWLECSEANPIQAMNKMSCILKHPIERLAAILDDNVLWIDLGWIDKVLPSCIGTKLLPCTHS